MRFAGATIADQDDRFGAFDVAALSQLVDPGCMDMGSLAEVELLQGFHPRQASLLNPSGNRVAFTLFQLDRQQRFQIAQVSLSLLSGCIGHGDALLGDGGQAQNSALLLHSCLLQIFYGGVHACTSSTPACENTCTLGTPASVSS